MASIYQSAIAVTVLDDEIRTVSASDSATVFLAYILRSTWNGRCWTYQEAVLGKELFFMTADGIESPPIADVAFFPGLEMGHSGQRWLTWRLLRSPISVFIKFAGGAYRLLPPTQLVSLGFKLACGLQAWHSCFRGSKEQPSGTTSALHRLRDAVKGFLLLCIAIAFTILTLPSTFIGITITYVGVVTFLLIWCLILLANGSETLPADLILKQGMRIQLASDLVGELQPSRVSPSMETSDPVAGARMHKQRFVHAWNAMAERTATKFEDLHVILASLTDVIPYRITALSTSAARMRGFASSYKTLPLALLFDRSLAGTTLRDPLNAWLPLAPVGDSNASHSQEASASEACFLVDVSPFRGRGDNGSTQTLRAARFLVHNRHTNSLHCQYDKLLAFKASKADTTHNANNMIRMSNDMSISMDFGKFSAGLQPSGRLLTLYHSARRLGRCRISTSIGVLRKLRNVSNRTLLVLHGHHNSAWYSCLANDSPRVLHRVPTSGRHSRPSWTICWAFLYSPGTFEGGWKPRGIYAYVASPLDQCVARNGRGELWSTGG